MIKKIRKLIPGNEEHNIPEARAEIILYQPDHNSLSFEVRIEDETVWLTQAQMAELFQTTRNNITLHISNIFEERELEKDSVCKDCLLTARDGKNYHTKIYNLDVIISVGYRVKSPRGTQFRIWANKILKEYLFRGYAVNHRFRRIEDDLFQLNRKIDAIDFQIKTNLPLSEGIFYEGQIFDAHHFVSSLIKSANKSIILIDNYIVVSSQQSAVSSQQPGTWNLEPGTWNPLTT